MLTRNRNIRILLEGPVNSDVNEKKYNSFSMETKGYFPLDTVFDKDFQLFDSSRIPVKEGYEGSCNKYILSEPGQYGHTAELDLVQYLNVKRKFNENVLKLSTYQLNIIVNTSGLGYSGLGYFARYKHFHSQKAFDGHRFKVDNTIYTCNAKTLIMRYNVEENKQYCVYAFTFKTQYIEELQKALLNGKLIKPEWLTVFIEKDSPYISTSRENGYKSSFKERFITPFVEKGVEIIYTHNILDKLAVAKKKNETYTFSSFNRDDIVSEKQALLLEFREREIEKEKKKLDIEMGLRSRFKYEAWKENLKASSLHEEFIEYVNEYYYSSVDLEDGMRRLIQMSGHSASQIYIDGKWKFTSHEDVFDKNPLLRIFRIFQGYSTYDLPAVGYFERESSLELASKIYSACQLTIEDFPDLNITLHNYVENKCIVESFNSGTYYELSNQKAILKEFKDYCPAQVYYSDSALYMYSESLNAYLDAGDLVTSTTAMQKNILEEEELFITTLTEYMDMKTSVPNRAVIYMWDLRMMFIVSNGLLFSYNYGNTSENEVISYLLSKVIDGFNILNNNGDSESCLSYDSISKQLFTMPKRSFLLGKTYSFSVYYDFLEEKVINDQVAEEELPFPLPRAAIRRPQYSEEELDAGISLPDPAIPEGQQILVDGTILSTSDEPDPSIFDVPIPEADGS